MSIVFTSATEVSDELKRRVLQISTANGWLTDIGAKVFRGKVNVSDDLVPCASIIEGTDEVLSTPGRAALWKIAQRHALVGYAPCDPDDPNVAAHKIIKDFKRAVFWTDGKPDTSLGRKVLEVHYKGRQIGPRADGAPIVMAIVEIEVHYVESPSQT